jgi:hypothetical protein
VDSVQAPVDGQLQYELESDWNNWTTGVLKDKQTCRKQDLFADPFQIIFNMAVEGDFFPPKEYGRLKDSEAKAWPRPIMEVDWVRVYQS